MNYCVNCGFHLKKVSLNFTDNYKKPENAGKAWTETDSNYVLENWNQKQIDEIA